MTYVHSFVSAKGGQGVSTTAAMMAILSAEKGHKTLLVGTDDTPAIMGFAHPEEGIKLNLIENLDVELDLVRAGTRRGYDLIVTDGMVSGLSADRVSLVTQPCYVALTRGLRFEGKFDDVVLVESNFRVLRKSDVENVLGTVVATIRHESDVARAVDAGTLTMRARPEFRQLKGLIPEVGVVQ